MASSDRGRRDPSARALVPLYERLPRGPHRLNPRQVIRNQRTRIHGATVEAVATGGYEGASVRQVVALAGVSRRSFYELFGNKQECFLQTFDLIAARGLKGMRRAYGGSTGDLESDLRAVFAYLAEAIATHRKEAGLVIVESEMAGPAGRARLRQALATCERMLDSSFAGAGASPLAMPVVRAIVGGLHAAAAGRLREEDAEEMATFGEEMLQWTVLFQTPSAERMAARVFERACAAATAGHRPVEASTAVLGEREAAGAGERDAPAAGERERLLHEVLRLALVDDFKQLSAPQIAEAADVPIDAFFELFADRDECFLAALDAVRSELMRVAEDPALANGDWPREVRALTRELMRCLAARPLYAETIAAGAFAAGAEAAERNRALGYELSGALVRGAPKRADLPLTTEGIRGALGHTVCSYVAAKQIELLPALSDYLAYVVLAPFIGADAAAELVIEEP